MNAEQMADAETTKLLLDIVRGLREDMTNLRATFQSQVQVQSDRISSLSERVAELSATLAARPASTCPGTCSVLGKELEHAVAKLVSCETRLEEAEKSILAFKEDKAEARGSWKALAGAAAAGGGVVAVIEWAVSHIKI